MTVHELSLGYSYMSSDDWQISVTCFKQQKAWSVRNMPTVHGAGTYVSRLTNQGFTAMLEFCQPEGGL